MLTISNDFPVCIRDAYGYGYDGTTAEEMLSQRGALSEDGKTFTFRNETYCIDDLKNVPIPDYDVNAVASTIIADFFELFTEVVLEADQDVCEAFIADKYRFSQMIHDSYVWEQAVDDALQEALPEDQAKVMKYWSTMVLIFIDMTHYPTFKPFYEKVYDKLADRVDELTQNMLTTLVKARLLQLKSVKAA